MRLIYRRFNNLRFDMSYNNGTLRIEYLNTKKFFDNEGTVIYFSKSCYHQLTSNPF